nr:translocation/assembly module TamB domain-containing protein [Muribaculaceae bacterium]
NLKAVDEVRANVTQTGQNSRLIDFDIILDVTGTLETRNVKFDLATNDDLTVANELQSMTAEQRANQAMNLLLYNMYTGPGTKGSANLGGNPLFSFLESQVNNWAANNIKGVDLQFGIDQYNQTTNGSTSQTMTYSYQVSKTLFNDRFKIVVGGNYSSNADAEENLSQNLINDISFEYYLNNQQTMLVKLFRHTGFESILEGEITQTGVGFVYRRKIGHLSQVLPKFMRPKRFRKVK